MLKAMCAVLVFGCSAFFVQEMSAGYVPMPAPTVAQLRMFGDFSRLSEADLQQLTQRLAQVPVFVREGVMGQIVDRGVDYEAGRARYARRMCCPRRQAS